MSEENRTAETTKKEEKTSLKVDIESIPFEADYSGKFISSIEFCKIANEIFKSIYDDFIGSTFELYNNFPLLSLYFAHGDFDGIKAVSKELDGTSTGNNVLDKMRNRDNMNRVGDRYHITEDGKDFIKKVLHPKYYNQGKIQWEKITMDIVERGNGYSVRDQQITKIVGIDPRLICEYIYGKEDEKGDKLDYAVYVLAVLNNFGFQTNNKNYALRIDKAYKGNLTKTYERFGVGSLGSNIVK